jgi:hypothetical protein
VSTPATFGIGEPFGHGLLYPDFIDGTSPAAGANYAYSVPGDYWMRVLGVLFTLVTDGNAANRAVTVDFINARGTTYMSNGFGAVITASTTQVIQFQIGRTVAEWAANTTIFAPLTDLFLQSGSQVQITVGSKQATDQLSAIHLAVEKFETGPRGYPEGVATPMLAGRH